MNISHVDLYQFKTHKALLAYIHSKMLFLSSHR